MGGGENPQLGDVNLNFPGGKFRIYRFPGHHLAHGSHHIFAAQGFGFFKHLPRGGVVKGELHNTGAARHLPTKIKVPLSRCRCTQPVTVTV